MNVLIYIINNNTLPFIYYINFYFRYFINNIITNAITPNTHIIGINKFKRSLQNILHYCLILCGYTSNKGTCDIIGIPIITTSSLVSFISCILIFIFLDNSIQLFKFKKLVLECNDETDTMFDEWKTTHLPNILPTNIKKSVHYDVKMKPFDYLKGMLYMNAVLEKEEHKLFQPLPLRNNIIPKHIILDTACIISLFCPENAKKSELLKKVKENQYDIWNNLLNLQHKTFKSKHYQYHHQLQTDGISCSLLFIRKDLKDKNGEAEFLLYKNKIFII